MPPCPLRCAALCCADHSAGLALARGCGLRQSDVIEVIKLGAIACPMVALKARRSAGLGGGGGRGRCSGMAGRRAWELGAGAIHALRSHTQLPPGPALAVLCVWALSIA